MFFFEKGHESESESERAWITLASLTIPYQKFWNVGIYHLTFLKIDNVSGKLDNFLKRYYKGPKKLFFLILLLWNKRYGKFSAGYCNKFYTPSQVFLIANKDKNGISTGRLH